MSDAKTIWLDKGEGGHGGHDGHAKTGIGGKLAASFKKHKRVWLIGAGCAIVLALYLYHRSTKLGHADDTLYTAAPVDNEPYGADSSTGGSGGANSQDYITPEQFRDTLGTLSGSLNDAFTKQQDAYNKQFDDLQSQILDARYASSPWSSMPYDMDWQTAPDVAPVDNSLATGDYHPTSDPTAAMPTPMGNPYYGNGGANYNTSDQAVRQSMIQNTQRLQTDDAFRQSEIARTQAVMKDRQAQGLDTSQQSKYMEAITVAQYGNGGANYKNLTAEEQKKMNASTQKLNSDAGYRASELERTNRVIEERKAAGMDTSTQEKYKAQITTASKGTSSSSSAKSTPAKSTTTAKSSTSSTSASTSAAAKKAAEAAAAKKAAEAKAAAAKKAAEDKAAKEAAAKKAAAAAAAAKKAAAAKTPAKKSTKK